MPAEENGSGGERIKRITERLDWMGAVLDEGVLAELCRRLPHLNAAEVDALLERLVQELGKQA